MSTAKDLRDLGMCSMAIHAGEGDNPYHAHITPIFQTSTFGFPDVATGAALFKGEAQGYVYTRIGNPNHERLAKKIAVLEGYDLIKAHPDRDPDDLVGGRVFTTGMAAVSSAVLARVRSGQTIITQQAVYGSTFNLFHDILPHYGVKVVFVDGTDLDAWQAAFEANPDAVLAYAETPANPTMAITDLAGVAEIAHAHNAWLMVDNTFATPYCQRPLTLGADVVIHSTTKYISGHGFIVGGAVISPHLDYLHNELKKVLKTLGGSPSPFDAWLTSIGLKTFVLRMERHCSNAMRIARYLHDHPKVAQVFYPGLEDDPGHEVAKKQMHCFGGMLSFELKGGFEAGVKLMENVKMMTLAVSLGNVDTLIQHPASMTHAAVPPEDRLKAGITDGLVRISVGVEDVEDLLNDLEQALAKV